MKKILPLSLSGLVAVTLWMPITTANAADSAIEQRLQRLERMTENPVLLQLSRRLGEQQREIQELHDDIDRLQQDLRNADQKANKRFKETDERLSALESGSAVAAPNSSAESPELNLPKNASEIESGNQAEESALKESMSDKGSRSSSQSQESQQSAENSVNEVAMGPVTTVPATELENAQYQKAFALMKSSKYDAAITAFEEFLSTSPQSDLASNAAYWAGEGYLIKKQNQAALDSFLIVIERYLDSPKVADAQLRAADSLANLNRKSEAKKMYQDVINNRPHSTAAQTASKRLSGL